MELIGCLVLFFLGHIYLEKEGLPQMIATMKLRFVLIAAVIFIAASVLLTKAFLPNNWLVMSTTVLSSTVIAYKYRKKFEKMERGGEV